MREEKFKVVSATDPAIDKGRMPWETMKRYWETREFSLVEPYFKPGEQPIIYHVRAVTNALFDNYVDWVDYDSVKHKRAFCAGVELVENLPQRDGSFTSWSSSKPPSPNTPGMTEEEAARFPPEHRTEIGRVIYAHCFLDPRKPLSLPPPPMSEQYLRATDFLGAAESQSTAVPNS